MRSTTKPPRGGFVVWSNYIIRSHLLRKTGRERKGEVIVHAPSAWCRQSIFHIPRTNVASRRKAAACLAEKLSLQF
jgi:hypothetical protein